MQSAATRVLGVSSPGAQHVAALVSSSLNLSFLTCQVWITVLASRVITGMQ